MIGVMEPAPAAHAARARRRHLAAPPLVRGDGQEPAQPRDAAAPLGSAGSPAPGKKHAPRRRGLRADVQGKEDRHWNIVASNKALPQLYEGVAQELLEPPVNAMRLSLHPQGIAPRIENLAERRAHLLARLNKQVEQTADPMLKKLLEEVSAYPAPQAQSTGPEHAVLVPLRINTPLGLLSFMSTTTVFGTPVDVTLAELAIEMFFPADEPTAQAVKSPAA